MSDTARGSRTVPRQGSAAPPQPTGWVGWIAFAAVLMIMMGVFHAMAGLVAIFQDTYYVATENLVLSFDYTTWGWVHLLFGVLFVAGGVALFSGRMWGRVLAAVLAVISTFVNFAFMPAYPVWSVIMLTVSVLVIWAVTVHGDEMKTRR